MLHGSRLLLQVQSIGAGALDLIPRPACKRWSQRSRAGRNVAAETGSDPRQLQCWSRSDTTLYKYLPIHHCVPRTLRIIFGAFPLAAALFFLLFFSLISSRPQSEGRLVRRRSGKKTMSGFHNSGAPMQAIACHIQTSIQGPPELVPSWITGAL